MISDFVAAHGSSELTVQKGQQVEVIDTTCVGAPEFCLVRLICNTNTTNNNVSSSSLSSSSLKDQSVQEGLVPSAILKPPPSLSKSKRHVEGEEGEKILNLCNYF